MPNTDITNTDLLLALRARKRRAGNASTAVKGNRDAKILSLLTMAHDKGMSTVSAQYQLEGWTRVKNAKVVADVTPAQVAGIIDGRAARAQELASRGIEHDVDYEGIIVLASTGSKPSRDARLGGRFYIIDVEKLDSIADAEYEVMVDDVDDDAQSLLTTVRPIVEQTDEDEDDSDDESVSDE